MIFKKDVKKFEERHKKLHEKDKSVSYYIGYKVGEDYLERSSKKMVETDYLEKE